MTSPEQRVLPHGMRRTRIIATIGPSSEDEDTLREMIRAGMDIARLNLSHGTYEEHYNTASLIRKAANLEGMHIGILVDIPGPKLRIIRYRTDIESLSCDAGITLGGDDNKANDILIGPKNCIPGVFPGDTILIADGAVVLEVISQDEESIVTKVISPGALKQGAGVVIPGRKPEIAYTSPLFIEHVEVACRLEPDYIALSFVGSGDDIRNARKIIEEKISPVPIIAKIETSHAVKHAESIIQESDAVMVARGDLGVELPLEQVPHIQKSIIRLGNILGKPVITATEMLESMIEHARPTRAEVTDVANAITDGTDATMLSAETSVGLNPPRAVSMMAKIARETEQFLPFQQLLDERRKWHEMTTEGIISYSAGHIAEELGCRAIFAYTRSGLTAERVSRCRPAAPVFAIVTNSRVARRLLLFWGVFPCQVTQPVRSADELFSASINLARHTDIAHSGDNLVIIAGNFEGKQGRTNMIKIEEIP